MLTSSHERSGGSEGCLTSDPSAVNRRVYRNFAEAIKYAADTTLVHEDEITVQELIQLLAERVDEVHETTLR